MSAPLTPSEEISMQQLARGLTAHQAARERYISHKTVKTQLSQAYRKLGARNGPARRRDLAQDPETRRPGMKRALIILAAVALAMVAAVPAGATTEIVGTHGNDNLMGGDGTQVIRGLAGNDKLHGGEDFDLLYGGPGNDKLFSGPDHEFDRLYGGTGNDVLNNWSPKDNSDWGSEYVTLDGGPGFDTCIGTPQVTVFISCEVIKTAP